MVLLIVVVRNAVMISVTLSLKSYADTSSLCVMI